MKLNNIILSQRIFFLVLAFLLLPFNNLLAGDSAENNTEDEEFRVDELIMHHIKDEHSWKILSYKNSEGEKKGVYFHLPVILIHDGDFHIFMSSEFKYNHGVVNRGDISFVNYHEKIYVANKDGNLKKEYKDDGTYTILNEKPINLSVTKNVFGMFVAALLVIFIFTAVGKGYRKRGIGAPKGIQSFFEPINESIFSVSKTINFYPFPSKKRQNPAYFATIIIKTPSN